MHLIDNYYQVIAILNCVNFLTKYKGAYIITKRDNDNQYQRLRGSVIIKLFVN